MKYIFVAGAPGSKWSSVVKNIYYSSDIDQSDYSEDRLYYHDASGKLELMHLGAYFDPGMACSLPEDLTLLNRQQLEDSFDYPFDKNSTGIRIIKSHIFSNHVDYLRRTFPEIPIVLVHRADDACLGWWVKCGHFDITYPLYHQYYRDLKTMAKIIQQQNGGIQDAIWNYKPQLSTPANNYELCASLGIKQPPREYTQNYSRSNITVKVIK
jgi:hypothetical protein